MIWTLKTTHTLNSGAEIKSVRHLVANSLTDAISQASQFIGPRANFSIHNLA